jgi:hypothetical protein
MTEITDPGEYNYYYRHPLEAYQVRKANRTLTTKIYLNKLVKLQTISTLVLFSSIILQVIAVSTSDWFVLNVNEYVQSAKGGLWYYCYIASAGTLGKLNCYTYENLPNYFVFANDRLFDSRVLFLCSSGFLLIILITEIVGIISLKRIEKKEIDLFDEFVAHRTRKFRFDDKNREDDFKYYTPNGTLRQASRGQLNVVQSKRTTKPIGYYAFLTFLVLSSIGSGLELVLKICAFTLFDAYINKLLSFNRVFMAYRSWSFWLMAGAIVFVVLYWVFKLLCLRHVLGLTKELQVAQRPSRDIKQDNLPHKDQMFAPLGPCEPHSSYHEPKPYSVISQIPRTSRFLTSPDPNSNQPIYYSDVNSTNYLNINPLELNRTSQQVVNYAPFNKSMSNSFDNSANENRYGPMDVRYYPSETINSKQSFRSEQRF